MTNFSCYNKNHPTNDTNTSTKQSNNMALVAILPFFLLMSFSSSIEAKTHFHNWDIAYKLKSPDCFQKLAITINGGTPGPTIDAQQGDTVVVKVHNKLFTENIAIHWHGIRQVHISFT